MYATTTQGYSHGATQVANTVGYVITDEIGNDESTGVAASVLDYMILNEIGYYMGVNQIHTGVLDYVIDNVSFNIIIEQERGWGFNWELITTLWETIDNNWENG